MIYHDFWQVADFNRFSWWVTCIETEVAEAAIAEAAKRREDTCRAGRPAQRIRVEASSGRGSGAVTVSPWQVR